MRTCSRARSPIRFLLAHLDKLQYLDYALVDANEAVQAREQYQDELEEMKEVKAIEDAALAREAEQLKYLAMLKDANVITLEVASLRVDSGVTLTTV